MQLPCTLISSVVMGIGNLWLKFRTLVYPFPMVLISRLVSGRGTRSPPMGGGFPPEVDEEVTWHKTTVVANEIKEERG